MCQIRSPLNALTYALIMHLLWPSATMAECVNLHTALLFFSIHSASCHAKAYIQTQVPLKSSRVWTGSLREQEDGAVDNKKLSRPLIYVVCSPCN